MNQRPLTDGELARLEREVCDKTRVARVLGGETRALVMMATAIAELKVLREAIASRAQKALAS